MLCRKMVQSLGLFNEDLSIFVFSFEALRQIITTQTVLPNLQLFAWLKYSRYSLTALTTKENQSRDSWKPLSVAT